MYWVKCKQSNPHRSLSTLCSFVLHVLLCYSNLSTCGHGQGHMIYLGNLWGVFSSGNTPEGHTETHKCSIFPYKQVSGRNGNHEWLRMTNAFILCDLLWKGQKSHAVNKEGSLSSGDNLAGVQHLSLKHTNTRKQDSVSDALNFYHTWNLFWIQRFLPIEEICWAPALTYAYLM